MNSRVTTSKFGSSWGEKLPILEYVYGIIDSKIDFIELKTRQVLEPYRTSEVKGSHRSDSWAELPTMSDVNVGSNDREKLFEHFEKLSRSIYLLEQLKLSLNEDNAFTIIQLLNDDNYLKMSDSQLYEILQIRVAA